MSNDNLTPLSVKHGNNNLSRGGIIRAPFGYVGCKFASANWILENLPYRNGYIEVFGGSGTILLNRKLSKLEVFNDRYSGVTCFYLCMQDRDTYQKLLAKIDNTIHSHEFWRWCKETWEHQTDVVDRAFRWFYMTQYSFGKLGRNFARTTKYKNGDSGKIINGIKGWNPIHDRFRKVCVENLDWLECINTYDNKDTVFYLDPPYMNTDGHIYAKEFSREDHIRLCKRIFKMKGYVALSGYDDENHLYDSCPWTKKITWDSSLILMQADSSIEKKTKEALWIKE